MSAGEILKRLDREIQTLENLKGGFERAIAQHSPSLNYERGFLKGRASGLHMGLLSLKLIRTLLAGGEIAETILGRVREEAE